MDIQYVNPGFQYSIQSIVEFQKEDNSSFWNDSLYFFYEELDKEVAFQLTMEEREEYITNILKVYYQEKEASIQEKIVTYQQYWNQYKEQITEALTEAFQLDCSEILNDLTCNITLNPVCPRFLEEKSFDLFYLNSEKGALGVTLHELIHFVWFVVWNKVFLDSYQEYESPTLKWLVSEMVVEAIMSDERLSSLNPYYPREHGGCIYPYFFYMEIEGKQILDTIYELYKTNSMIDFMKKSFAYCQLHESEIRKQITEYEG